MTLAIDVNDKNRARYGLLETFTTEEKDVTKKLVPNGNNGVEWIDAVAGLTLETVVQGESLASSQEPSSLDTPLQIEFGVAQSSTQIDLSVLGRLTIKEAGIYLVTVHGQYGAPAGGGESALRFRAELNGVPVGDVLSATVKDAKTSVPLTVSFWIQFAVNDEWEAYVMRDSSESNKGGLFQETTALAGWDDSPSASILVERFI